MTSLQKATLPEIRNAAARICRDYLTGKWKNIRAEELIVKRISGGLSNFLYYVALPEIETNESSRKRSLGTVIDNNSTAIHNAQNEFTDIANVDGTLDGDNIVNASKRQRTDSGSSSDNLSSFATKRFSCASLQGNEPKQVLLRIYGQSHGEDALEAMITESVVFALLSERNFGPKLHGIFPGGRIEQYVPARALTTHELSDEKISMKIAEKMGEIHSLNIPMSKEPDWIWNCMDRWLVSVDNILKSESLRKKYENSEIVFSFDFADEAIWLKSVIDENNFLVAFCHNDLQEGNILYMEQDAKQPTQMKLRDDVFAINELDMATSLDDSSQMGADNLRRRRTQQVCNNSTNGNSSSMNHSLYHLENEVDTTRDSALSINSFSFAATEEEWEQENSNNNREPNLMIIDFEYCAYNYRGFDLANHFLEWTFDYTNPEFPNYYHYKEKYPSEHQRRLFITAYLRKLNCLPMDFEPPAEEIAALEYEIRVFSMLSHLFWSLWSIVNVNSNIEFGYWEYAVTRIQEYKELKQAFLYLKTASAIKNNNN